LRHALSLNFSLARGETAALRSFVAAPRADAATWWRPARVKTIVSASRPFRPAPANEAFPESGRGVGEALSATRVEIGNAKDCRTDPGGANYAEILGSGRVGFQRTPASQVSRESRRVTRQGVRAALERRLDQSVTPQFV